MGFSPHRKFSNRQPTDTAVAAAGGRAAGGRQSLPPPPCFLMSLSFQASRFEQFARAGRLRMTVKGGYENEHGNKLEQISSGGCRLSCSPGLPSCLLPSACLFVIGFVVCERGAPPAPVCPRTCICICVRTLVGACVPAGACLHSHRRRTRCPPCFSRSYRRPTRSFPPRSSYSSS